MYVCYPIIKLVNDDRLCMILKGTCSMVSENIVFCTLNYDTNNHLVCIRYL